MMRGIIQTEEYITVMKIDRISIVDGEVYILPSDSYCIRYKARAKSAYAVKEREELRKAAETGFYESYLIFEEENYDIQGDYEEEDGTE